MGSLTLGSRAPPPTCLPFPFQLEERDHVIQASKDHLRYIEERQDWQAFAEAHHLERLRLEVRLGGCIVAGVARVPPCLFGCS